MKFLYDFFPVLLFFSAYYIFKDPADSLQGILWATGAAILATVVQVAISWFRRHKVEKMHLATLGILVVLGGATFLFRDEMFIKWKPTVVEWLFGLVFLASQYVGEKPIIRRMLEGSIELPDPIWGRLNMAWVVFFIGVGFANLYVAYHFDTDTWVNFKMFGLMGLTFAFAILQGFYISRHIIEPDKEPENS